MRRTAATLVDVELVGLRVGHGHRDVIESGLGGGDVEVQPVLDRLALRHLLEPDPRAAAGRVDDAVLTDAEVRLDEAEVASP